MSLKQILFENRKRIVVFLMVVLILGFFGWKLIGGSKSQKPEYQTAAVERGTLVVDVSASGDVISSGSVNISTQATGVVRQVLVKRGDFVSQGQVLAQLDLDQEAQQRQAAAWSNYLSAKNALATANQNKLAILQTWQTDQASLLSAQMAADPFQNYDPTDKNKQKADANRRAAELGLQLDQQKYSLSDSQIAKAGSDLNSAWLAYRLAAAQVVAPIAGTVSNLTVTTGSAVVTASGQGGSGTTASQKLGTITRSLASPQAVVNLSELDVMSVKLDQKATLTLDALPNKTFTGRVLTVDTSGQVSSGVTTYPTTIVFDQTEVNIYPNMAVTTKIITNVKDNVLLVPSAAVQTNNGGSSVRVLKNGRVNNVRVQVGESNDSQTEIISGLSEGEIVITGVSNGTGNRTANSANSAGSSPFSVFGGGGRGFGGAVFRRLD